MGACLIGDRCDGFSYFRSSLCEHMSQGSHGSRGLCHCVFSKWLRITRRANIVWMFFFQKTFRPNDGLFWPDCSQAEGGLEAGRGWGKFYSSEKSNLLFFSGLLVYLSNFMVCLFNLLHHRLPQKPRSLFWWPCSMMVIQNHCTAHIKTDIWCWEMVISIHTTDPCMNRYLW